MLNTGVIPKHRVWLKGKDNARTLKRERAMSLKCARGKEEGVRVCMQSSNLRKNPLRSFAAFCYCGVYSTSNDSSCDQNYGVVLRLCLGAWMVYFVSSGSIDGYAAQSRLKPSCPGGFSQRQTRSQSERCLIRMNEGQTKDRRWICSESCNDAVPLFHQLRQFRTVQTPNSVVLTLESQTNLRTWISHFLSLWRNFRRASRAGFEASSESSLLRDRVAYGRKNFNTLIRTTLALVSNLISFGGWLLVHV